MLLVTKHLVRRQENRLLLRPQSTHPPESPHCGTGRGDLRLLPPAWSWVMIPRERGMEPRPWMPLGGWAVASPRGAHCRTRWVPSALTGSLLIMSFCPAEQGRRGSVAEPGFTIRTGTETSGQLCGMSD